MKKDSTKENAAIREVAGLDLGDKYSQLCVLDRGSGETLEESRLATTAQALRRRFEGVAPMRIALEVGTHSPWVSRLLEQLGHEVLVANARKLRLIYKNRRKTDKVDAEYLARLARVDPELLHPLQHRGEQAQSDLAVLRSRDALVKVRTQLVNHVRGAVKSLGHRLPKCTAKGFARKVVDELPAPLRPALTPLLETLTLVNEQIKAYDRELEQTLVKKYPESELLLQVRGVGPVTALAYLLIPRGPRALRQESQRRCLPGPGAGYQRIRRVQPRAPHHQRRRRLLTASSGRVRSLHPGTVRAGLRPQTVRGAHRATGRQERQEASRRGGGAQAGRAAAPTVAQRGSL